MPTTSSSAPIATGLLNLSTTRTPITNTKANANVTASYAGTRSSDQSANVPPELDQYLTTTSHPGQIFESLQEDRDRRLRLLLRRFTNQIQYGCRNPYCNVVTCLSYRTRHTKTPIRAYTDVAARALAWRCVEEYADIDRELSYDTGAVSSKQGGNHGTSHGNGSGLCWNEPVVPWYEDRALTLCGHKIYTKQQTEAVLTASSTSKASRAPKSGPSRAQVDGFQHEEVMRANRLTECSDTTPHIVDVKDIWLLSCTESSSERAQQSLDASRHENLRSEPHTQHHRRVVFAEPVADNSKEYGPMARDKASFTQMVYDTSSIRKFDLYPSEKDRRSHSPSSHVEESVKVLTDLFARSLQDEEGVRTNPSLPAFAFTTFKLLPLSAILWLRSTMPFDEQSSPLRDLNTTIDHGQYSRFARQSLYFCLSNPKRLLRSASTWRFVHRQPHKLDEEKRNCIIKDLTMEENLQLKQNSTVLAQPGGIMVAFGMLIAIVSIPEILDHLFTALQHSYKLPSWLENPSSKHVTTLRRNHAIRQVQSHSQGGLVDTESGHPASKTSGGEPDQFLEDRTVAQLCILVVLALQLILALKSHPLSLTHAMPLKDFGEQYSASRRSGKVFPYANLFKAWSNDADTRPNYQAYTSRLDTIDGWAFQRILDGMADVISHRFAITGLSKAAKTVRSSEQSTTVVDMFIDELFLALRQPDAIIHKHTLQKNLIDLMRSVVLRRWDRAAIIQRRGPVGGALELLAALFRKRTELDIPVSDFQWSFIGDAFDEIDMPMEWLDFREDNKQTHILAYSFLFEPATLVVYFRAINSIRMKRSHQSASSIFTDAFKLLRNPYFNVYGADEVLREMRPNMARFFVLTVRRSNMLQDAFNQLWRRQRQEILRPLKVRLGREEGEDGLDHGGVQAEFFRLVLAEALDPDYGMFTIDDRTRMAWFQPASMEPLYKFEVLGILVSLAVYNGVTLPITFPIAFYRKLLGFKVKTLQHVQDGWPDLARGLQQLLDWNDGDVGDVVYRTYEFSYEAFGMPHSVDMTKVGRNDSWPPMPYPKSNGKAKTTSFELTSGTPLSPSSRYLDFDEQHLPGSVSPRPTSSIENVHKIASPSASSSTYVSTDPPESSISEAPLVTNANRSQYVKDYIHWLTNKSVAPQFDAFLNGFTSCLDQTALSIFTPEHLKIVIEGHQHIDIDSLEATTTYDDYESSDEIIHWFWDTVRDMSIDQHRKLLEFVTASDRVPVNGIQSIVFIIQKNGEGNERLPSSSTCYGRLLLPKYSSKEVLREKLEKAIDNSVGFGSL